MGTKGTGDVAQHMEHGVWPKRSAASSVVGVVHL